MTKKLRYLHEREVAESYQGSNKSNYIVVDSDGKTILFNDYEDDVCTLTNQEKLIKELRECPLFVKEIVDKYHSYLIKVYKTEEKYKINQEPVEEEKIAKQRKMTHLSLIERDRRKYLTPLFKLDDYFNSNDSGIPIFYIEELSNLVSRLFPIIKEKEPVMFKWRG